MARARNIKPAFFTNELLGTVDPIIGMTFIGLWCLADKNGILEDRPLRIKAELFPYRDGLDINGYLTVLEQLGFVFRYEVDSLQYIQIVNFSKHQSPHHTEKSKNFPKYHGVTPITVKPPLPIGDLTVPKRSDSLIPDSLIPDLLNQETTTTATSSPVVIQPETPSPSVFDAKPEISKPEPPVARNTQIAVLLRQLEKDRGKFAKITGSNPQILAWIDHGVTDEQVREAYALAVAYRASKGDDGAVNAGIVDTFIAQILAPPAGVSALNRIFSGGVDAPWQATWSGIVSKGRELGIFESDSEPPPAFKARVFEAAHMTVEEKSVLRADFGVRV